VSVKVYGPQKLIGVNGKESALLRVDCRVDLSPVRGPNSFLLFVAYHV